MDKKILVSCCLLVVLLALSIQLVRCGDESKGSHDGLKNNTQQSDMTPTPTESQAPTRRDFRFQSLLDFTGFKKKFNRHYGSLVEEMARLKLFLARLFRAKSSRIAYMFRYRPTFLGINSYSDRTDKERAIAVGGELTKEFESHSKEAQNSDEVTKKRRKRSASNDEQEEEPTGEHILNDRSGIRVDLRRLGCFNPPRDQERCLACYAFVAITQYEFLYCLIYGKRIQFSEQYAIDCGKDYNLKGCYGGRHDGMYLFAHLRGMELSGNYKYRGGDGPCLYDNSEGLFLTNNAGRFVIGKPHWEHWLKRKVPLYVIFTARHDIFFDYAGGVDLPTCNLKHRHAMLLVGVGSNSKGDYYILRNSFGPSWGESGYYYAYAHSHCWEDFAYAPQILKRPSKQSFFKNARREDLRIPELDLDPHRYEYHPAHLRASSIFKPGNHYHYPQFSGPMPSPDYTNPYNAPAHFYPPYQPTESWPSEPWRYDPYRHSETYQPSRTNDTSNHGSRFDKYLNLV